MSAAQTVPVLLTEEKGLKEEQNNGNQSNYVGWVFSQKHVRQVSDSKVYEQAEILTFLRSLIHHTCLEKNITKKTLK